MPELRVPVGGLLTHAFLRMRLVYVHLIKIVLDASTTHVKRTDARDSLHRAVSHPDWLLGVKMGEPVFFEIKEAIFFDGLTHLFHQC